MKRLGKWLAGLAVVILVLGLAMMAAGWWMGGETTMTVDLFGRTVNIGIPRDGVWRLERPESPESWTEVIEPELDAFTTLRLDVDLADVTVLSGSDYGLELRWNIRDYALQYTNEHGTLHIWSESTAEQGVALGDTPDAQIILTIPGGAEPERMELHSGLGDCSLSALTVGDLIVEANMGNVALADVTAAYADLTLNAGSLSLERVTAQTMSAELDMGSMTARALVTTTRLAVRNGMGDTDLTGDFQGEVRLFSSLGKVRVNVLAPVEEYSYDFRASMGDIWVDEERWKESAERTGGENTLRIENDMGDIDVTFN